MISITPSEIVTPISMVRNRNEVLKHLLPKIFGIISREDNGLKLIPAARPVWMRNSHCRVVTWTRIALR